MKNKRLAILTGIALVLIFSVSAGFAQDKRTKDKETSCGLKTDSTKCSDACTKESQSAECCEKSMVCPVSGEAAKKDVFSEHKGRKVYFCCAKCKAAFDKDPAKYEAKIHKCSGSCGKECGAACKDGSAKKECKDSREKGKTSEKK